MADLTADAIHFRVNDAGDFEMRAAPAPVAAAADVRYGVTNGDATGTLRVPAASDVRAGVAVDHTTGTMTGGGGGIFLPTSNESERWFSTMVKARGVEVEYARGTTTEQVIAIPTASESASDDLLGTVRRSDEKDFLFLRSSFSTFGEPERGDRITWVGITYAVGEPPYRKMTPDGVIMRANTRRVS